MYFSPRAGLVGAYLLFALCLSAAAPILKEKQSVSIFSDESDFLAPSIFSPSIFAQDVEDSQVRPRDSLNAGRDSYLDGRENILERRGLFHAIRTKFQASVTRVSFNFYCIRIIETHVESCTRNKNWCVMVYSSIIYVEDFVLTI